MSVVSAPPLISLSSSPTSRAAPLIRSATSRAVEVAWYGTLCSEDYEFLGVPNDGLRSNFENCANTLRLADRLGFQNCLLPTLWDVGQDPLLFASAVAPQLKQLSQLIAIRCGETHPPALARAISTLDHLTQGRLTINIISSDLAGVKLDSPARYRRSGEVIDILKQAWTQDRIRFKGEFYDLDIDAEPAKPYQQNGGPLLYFGGMSPDAQALAAKHADVFLMWPEPEAALGETMQTISQQAAAQGRTLDFGLRVHMIVRETEAEAKAAADRLISRLDLAEGQKIRARSIAADSAGVSRQDQARAAAGSLYLEPHLWSGIGLARSGCGSALVGNPDQIVAKLERYIDMGIRAFIFSGYPNAAECQRFADLVLPRLQTCRLAKTLGRLPDETPVTPLTTKPRR